MTYSPQNAFTFPFDTQFPLLPALNFITSISQSNPAVVTTQTDHGYASGLTVRIVFPHTVNNPFGMPQIDEQQGLVTVISPDSFFIDINTTNFDPFIFQTIPQMAQIIPTSVQANSSVNDSTQLNPTNPNPRPVIFQPTSPICSGPCSVP